jgi:tetraacyldisaccharide 4'-kinase
VRAALEAAARRWWGGELGGAGRALSVAALPLELLFRGAVAARTAAYAVDALRSEHAPLPVVSVGNLTVGGTGKTPLSAWVVRVLREGGRRPALALRGYGRDEAMLHERWNPTALVHVGPDRFRSARAAAATGADVLVLDDGFQHLRIARDLDLVLVAAEQRFPGRLLPRGPYREPPGALARADRVIVTRRVATPAAAARVEAAVRAAAPDVPVARAHLAPLGWQDLTGGPADAPRGDVLAVAGVAGPEAFAALVGARTRGAVELLAFPDHHEYGPGDVEKIRRAAAGRPVVATEKDAVKLARHAGSLPDVRVLALAVEVEVGEDALRAAVLDAATRRSAAGEDAGRGGR